MVLMWICFGFELDFEVFVVLGWIMFFHVLLMGFHVIMVIETFGCMGMVN